MTQSVQPDGARLAASREVVHSFLAKKKRWSLATFVLAVAFELVFLVALLVLMDFGDRFHWFLLTGFLFVYLPTITLAWRNSIKIDHLYYRLVEELKYNGPGSPETTDRST